MLIITLLDILALDILGLDILGMAFIDQGEFEAMKTLSGWETAHCDGHLFRAKIKVSA